MLKFFIFFVFHNLVAGDPSKAIFSILETPSVASCTTVFITTTSNPALSTLTMAMVNAQKVVSVLTMEKMKESENFHVLLEGRACVAVVVAGEAAIFTEMIQMIWDLKKCGRSRNYIFLAKDKEAFEAIRTNPLAEDIVNLVMIVEDEAPVIPLWTIEKFGGSHGQVITKQINTWIEHRGLMMGENVFYDKFINFNGAHLRGVWLPSLPFMNEYTWPDGTQSIGGADLDQWKAIAESLNFQFDLRKSIDEQWGGLIDEKTNSWSGMVGMLQRSEVDIQLGALTVLAAREQVIDFTIPYYEEPTSFVTHKPAPLAKWLAIFSPFGPEVWASVVGSVLVFIFVFWVFVYMLEQEKFFRFKWVAFSIAGSILNQGIRKPKKTGSRVIIGFWFFYCLIICASYSGSLIAFLTAPAMSRPLETLEELANSDYKVYFVDGSVQTVLFKQSTDPLYRAIWDDHVMTQDPDDRFCSTYEECVEWCSQETKVASVFDYTLNKVSAQTTHSNLRGEHDIHFARAKFFISGYGYGLKTNAPYMDKVNDRILHIFKAGLLSRWMDDAMNEYRAHKKAVIEDQVARGKEFVDKVVTSSQNRGIQALSIDNLQGAFMLWLTGIGLATVVGLVEMSIGGKGKYPVKSNKRIVHF